MDQRRFGAGVTLVLGELLLRFGVSAAGDNGRAEKHLDVARGASLLHRLAADAVDELLHAGLALSVEKDAFGVRRRKARTPWRRAGLVKHRRALRRGLAQVHGIELVLLARVVHAVDSCGIGIDAIRAIAQHRAVFPAALPQLVDQLHVFVGQVVAVVVRGLAGQAGGMRRAVEVAGDDIPADAPASQVVQRRHPACKQEGRFVSEVGGDAEAEMLRDGRHRRDQQGRVVHRHLHGAAHRRVGTAAQHVVDTNHVGEKDAVEQAGFQPFRIVGPVVDVQVARRLVARMGPQPLLDVADAVHVERIDADFTGHEAVRFLVVVVCRAS